LWDKIGDINKSLIYIKNYIKTEHKLTLVSFDDIYSYYQGYCTVNDLKFIVSKRYFEKYLYHKFVDYIVYEKFIKVEWANT
jgi:phage/plasmid-associated DNA primase